MTGGIVFDIKKFSVHDGPGIRTTVFLKGCGLRCWWCHNPESQHPQPELMLRPNLCIACGACAVTCPQDAIHWDSDQYVTDRDRCQRCGTCVEACFANAREIVGQEMTVADVMDEILRDRAFYDQSRGGVTFSGGEPLFQTDFLAELLSACKAEEIQTVVDTCGYAPQAAFDRVRQDVDLFLYDVKLMDSARHRRVTGAPNDRVLSNLRWLSAKGHRIIVRIPIIPNINDDEDNLHETARFLRTLSAVERVDLLAYHRIGVDKYDRLARTNPMPPTDAPDDSRMTEIEQLFRDYGLQVKTGG
ncbi:MAG: glycyl-radical enzyme activating protein [Anaerolineae bacterium]|nr:glycyl-radical enzyme activating protein [Anaerolineae bacterium]